MFSKGEQTIMNFKQFFQDTMDRTTWKNIGPFFQVSTTSILAIRGSEH